MLNTYDNFTLNSIFRPKAFIKKKMHFKINYIVSVPTCWNRDYVGNIEVNILLNIELRVKLSYVIMFSVKVYIF